MTSRCKGCGAEVIWIKTKANARRMPVDAEPIWILMTGKGKSYFKLDGTVLFGQRIGDAWDDDPDANAIQVYESHFATCPVGGQFRNRKTRTRAPGYR